MTLRNDLRVRARTLRLSNIRIAEAAKLDKNTVARVFDQRETKVHHASVEAVEAVILAEEAALRAKLPVTSGAGQ